MPSLLNKINIFEKLSLYGNRSSFLKALAQQNQLQTHFENAKTMLASAQWLVGHKFTLEQIILSYPSNEQPNVRQTLNEMNKSIQQPLTNDVSQLMNLGNAITILAEKYIKPIKELTTTYDQLRSLIFNVTKELEPIKSAQQEKKEETYSQIDLINKPMQNSEMTRIDPTIQMVLNKLMPKILPDFKPLKEDGILGPLTRAALISYNNFNHLGFKYNDKKLFDKIMADFQHS